MSNYRGKKRKAPPAVEEEEAFPRGGSNRPAPDAAATPADKAKPVRQCQQAGWPFRSVRVAVGAWGAAC